MSKANLHGISWMLSNIYIKFIIQLDELLKRIPMGIYEYISKVSKQKKPEEKRLKSGFIGF